MITKEEILDAEYKKFIEWHGIKSIYPKSFPSAYNEPALAAMEAYANQDKWINVEIKEDLPEVGEWVLLCFESETTLKGKRLYDGWLALFADGEKSVGSREPTHWQPLPKTPEKQTNDNTNISATKQQPHEH